MAMIKEIFFAGGCFWGMEQFFSLIEGVIETEVGYANGKTENPSYEQVCTGLTNHAETVRVRYDSDVADLASLLGLFFQAIDPTAVNRQGNDVGTQYRSGIYYTDPSDQYAIHQAIEALKDRYRAPIAVEVAALTGFHPAEAYHQRYLRKNPNGYCHIGQDKFDLARGAKPRVHRSE